MSNRFHDKKGTGSCGPVPFILCPVCYLKAYVLEHHGLKVSSRAIAQAKKKCGLEVGECYDLPSGHGRPSTILTPEREAAIREAFQYYGLI